MKESKLIEINDAWLGLDVSERDIFNPMSILSPDDEDFHLKVTWLLSKPEYFSFTIYICIIYFRKLI